VRRIVVFGTAALLAIATLEARQQQDPDHALHAGNVTILSVIGYEYEVTQADGPEPTTHLELRNVNLFSNSWNSFSDSVLLRVQGKKANAAHSQGFGVVACDRATDPLRSDVASISLMRVGNPREVITSTNAGAGAPGAGPVARTASRFIAEGKSETLYAVLTAPSFSGGAIAAGWQIASAGYRNLNVSLVAAFNVGGGPALVIGIGGGCGQSIYPF
jgi:hypothetical protein